jgi:hypothetical protein
MVNALFHDSDVRSDISRPEQKAFFTTAGIDALDWPVREMGPKENIID